VNPLDEESMKVMMDYSKLEVNLKGKLKELTILVLENAVREYFGS